MDKIKIDGVDYLKITRDDGSIQTIEVNLANPEYLATVSKDKVADLSEDKTISE